MAVCVFQYINEWQRVTYMITFVLRQQR